MVEIAAQMARSQLVGTSQYDGSGVRAPKGGRLAYATRRAGAEAVWTRTAEDMSDQKLLGPADVPGSHMEYFTGLSFSPDGAWLSALCAKFSPALESRVGTTRAAVSRQPRARLGRRRAEAVRRVESLRHP